MKLGMQVSLDPGHIVLDGDPAPPPQRGAKPPIFGPYLLWRNGWMDQDATWYGGRTRPRRLCVFVLDGDPAPPSPKVGRAPSPIFGTCPLWPNGWMDQDRTWHRGRPWSRLHCDRLGPSSLPKKRGQSPLPVFGPFLLWPNGWMHQDATRYGGRPRQVCVTWGPSPLPKKGAEPPPQF